MPGFCFIYPNVRLDITEEIRMFQVEFVQVLSVCAGSDGQYLDRHESFSWIQHLNNH